MTVSESAQNYLNTLKRDPDWITNSNDTQKYLSRFRLDNANRLLQIQQEYSGYTFTENEHSEYAIRLHFLSNDIITKNKKIYYTTVNGVAAFSMDNGKSVPYYLLTEDGAIAYWDDEAYRHFCLYESIEIMIEIRALEREYQYYLSSPAKELAAENIEAIINHMNDHYTFLSECSDKFQYYWQTDFDIIRIFYNDYNEEYSLHISSISSHNSQLILDGLKRDNLYI